MATTVVIVDDHPGFRASARMLLDAEGYEVLGEAENGQSGLAVVAELDPDVVLLDIQLPDMDGFQVAARLAAAGTRGAIVLVSSRAREDLRALVEGSAARGFIPKSELSGDTLEAVIA
jgi:DNA-binding NarL/FixJ family response regulator